MKKAKRFLALLICLTLVLTMSVGCGSETKDDTEDSSTEVTDSNFNPGTYEGEGTGYGGPIKVEVELDEEKIVAVNILDHSETTRISDPAMERIPHGIVEHQSIKLDTISGATFTSLGIMSAVKDAIVKSGSDISLVDKEIVKEDIVKTDEEKTAEVIVIGGGGAGLAAVVSAYENGAESVILVEKMPILGGNTMRAGGAYNAVNPEKQNAQGIEDSIEKHFQQTYEGGHKVADKTLVEILVNNALDGVHWLEGYGLEWNEKIGSVIGSMWERSNQTIAPLGTGFIEVLEKAARDKDCDILLETEAKELLLEDGRVVGVKAEGLDKNYILKAEKGVILATGGYGASPKMAREYLSDGVYTKDNLPENIPSTNSPGALGDGIIMAEAIDAQVIDMKHVQLLPMPGDKFGPSINVEDSFFINKEGKRYVKEDGGRDEICLSTFEQPDGQYYMINDSKIIPETRKTLSGEDLDKLIDKGTVVEADSLEELAEAIGVPAENLIETCEKFNDYVEKKEDPEFGRAVWGDKIDQAPFYATLRYPALHHTMGGIKINGKTQVLSTANQPIPGLYAAGEVTGGIHGANRLGGNAITDIIVFGKIAGKSVME